MTSFTEENYLKAIYRLTEESQQHVSTNDLAAKMQTRPPSVTDMIKKLSLKGLVNYLPYQGVMLTEEGRKIALSVIRKHRLWEYFLVDTLKFNWDEIHEIAEELEHIHSPKLIDRLDAFLNYPSFDPHGDPIPDANGQLPTSDMHLLSEATSGCEYSLSGVIDHSPLFLQQLSEMGLELNASFQLLRRLPFDQSVEIELDGQRKFNLSERMARLLFVKVCTHA